MRHFSAVLWLGVLLYFSKVILHGGQEVVELVGASVVLKDKLEATVETWLNGDHHHLVV